MVIATSFNARDAVWLSWFSSQITQMSAAVMPISWYIVVAMVRCSAAPVTCNLPRSTLGLGKLKGVLALGHSEASGADRASRSNPRVIGRIGVVLVFQGADGGGYPDENQ